MKLAPRDAARFFAKPDPDSTGILIFGPDAMRVALKRQDLIAALVGPNGDAEMRFTRIAAGDLRRDPAQLTDALRVQAFFPGPRAVLVEDATDTLTKSIAAALEDWAPGDAMLVVTAGPLNARSALRKLFEGSKTALSAAIYADPPGRDEIEATLARAGLRDLPQDALRDLTTLGQALDPGDFRQTVEKLALFKHGDAEPVTAADIAMVAPLTSDALVDNVISDAADGAMGALCAALPRLAAQGATPTGLCIALQRHFRQVHAAASDPQGPEQALGRMRPPVFGPRRDRMLRQARHWGTKNLEEILHMILETDRTLRSSSPAPAQALVERLMMRIAINHARIRP